MAVTMLFLSVTLNLKPCQGLSGHTKMFSSSISMMILTSLNHNTLDNLASTIRFDVFEELNIEEMLPHIQIDSDPI